MLFEEKEGEYIKGHTTNYIVVKMPYESVENKIKKVKIEKMDGLELVGK